jgi:hypothetical protein
MVLGLGGAGRGALGGVVERWLRIGAGESALAFVGGYGTVSIVVAQLGIFVQLGWTRYPTIMTPLTLFWAPFGFPSLSSNQSNLTSTPYKPCPRHLGTRSQRTSPPHYESTPSQTLLFPAAFRPIATVNDIYRVTPDRRTRTRTGRLTKPWRQLRLCHRSDVGRRREGSPGLRRDVFLEVEPCLALMLTVMVRELDLMAVSVSCSAA